MIQQSVGGSLALCGRIEQARKVLSPVLSTFEGKNSKGWWVDLARRYGREASR
jgi:hypothetical protein